MVLVAITLYLLGCLLVGGGVARKNVYGEIRKRECERCMFLLGLMDIYRFLMGKGINGGRFKVGSR